MRGAITSWSRKSRANMCRKLAEYDYNQMFADARTPAMVTFTYPDDWLTVAPSGTAGPVASMTSVLRAAYRAGSA